MQTLESPPRRYTTGKLPSHSTLEELYTNFKSMPQAVIESALIARGLVTDEGLKPTRRALQTGVMDVCDRTFLWKIEEVGKILESGGLKVQRQYANQAIPAPTSSDPVWVNLTTLSTYFNATPSTVGKWLDALGLRESDGLPTKDAQDRGLGNVSEMSAGKKKTRKIATWESYRVRRLLRDAGHPLDFDYAKSLAAKGKNGAVKVESIDSRAETFAEGFAKVFKKGSLHEVKAYVGKTPKPILMRAEKLLGRPEGWLTSGAYIDRLS